MSKLWLYATITVLPHHDTLQCHYNKPQSQHTTGNLHNVIVELLCKNSGIDTSQHHNNINAYNVNIMTTHNDVVTHHNTLPQNAHGHHGIAKPHNASRINRGECTQSTIITRRPCQCPDCGFP